MYPSRRLAAAILLVIAVIFMLPLTLSAQWTYSMPIRIDNGGGAVSDYLALVTVNTAALVSAGKMQADGDDIRFSGPSCESLSYWIQDGINTTTTNIWVKIPTLPAGPSVIAMDYGNGAATTASSVTSVFGTGIAALYTFTEGTGTTLHDWVGAKDLTITGLTWGAGARAGVGSLSGFSSGRVYRTDGGPALGTAGFSTLAFINATNPNGSTQGIIGNYANDGTNGWVLKQQGGAGQFMFLTNQGGSWCQASAGTIPSSTWTMVGAVRNSGVGKELYQNGSAILSHCGGDARNVDNAGPFEIGRSYNGTYAFAGNISLAAVYSTALSSTQMAALTTGLRPAVEPTLVYGSEIAIGSSASVTLNPVSNTITCSGGSVSFTSSGSGYGIMWWERSTDGGGTWTVIPGATSTTYTINPTAVSQAGHQFRAVFAASGCSMATTSAATLNLYPAPSLAARVTPSSIAYRVGKMRTIYATITPSGNCGPFTTQLVSITANESILATDIQYASYGTSPADLIFNVASSRNTAITPRIYTVTYRVTDASGSVTDQTATVTVPLVGGMKPATPDDETDAVAGLSTLENSPNPFSAETEIRFLLGSRGRVSLAVFDAAGRLVAQMVDEQREAGMYFERWSARGLDGGELPAGTYYARLVTPTDSRTVPLHVVR